MIAPFASLSLSLSLSLCAISSFVTTSLPTQCIASSSSSSSYAYARKLSYVHPCDACFMAVLLGGVLAYHARVPCLMPCCAMGQANMCGCILRQPIIRPIAAERTNAHLIHTRMQRCNEHTAAEKMTSENLRYAGSTHRATRSRQQCTKKHGMDNERCVCVIVICRAHRQQVSKQTSTRNMLFIRQHHIE